MSNPPVDKKNEGLPFSYARPLSWLSLVVILITSLGLSVTISNSARETLLSKQQDFANLLATNLNHQIYMRFTVPTVLAYGRIALRQPAQYERLDQVVQSVIHGLKLERLRIYDHGRLVAYSTDGEDLGRPGRAPLEIEEALKGAPPSVKIITPFPMWQAPFYWPFEKGTFLMRTLYPLTGEDRTDKTQVMGVLEVTQDITGDYESVMAFQGLIVFMCLLSSAVMFTILLYLIRRAERILAERMAETRKLERDLLSHEKLASMGRIISSIAHEIRNPLGIIRSSAELLLKRADSADHSTKRICTAIYDEACRLSKTVNDFLDYARPRSPRQDVVDVNLLLGQAITFLEGVFAAGQLAVELQIEDKLFTTGDQDLLYRAFYNILVNSQQAINGPGIITVNGKNGSGDTVELIITDNGPGFREDILEHALDPFFTTKDDGTGLGLPIVNSIITSHGGKLVLGNNPDGGAMISVTLPKYVRKDGTV